MIAIIKGPLAAMNACADAPTACRCLVPMLACGITRRKDAVVDRSGFSNKASSLPLGLWDKSNNLTHVSTPLSCNDRYIPRLNSVDADFEAGGGQPDRPSMGAVMP